MQGEIRGRFQTVTVAVEVGAEHRQRGDFREGIHECGAEPREHVQVRAACLDEREQAAAVHPFTIGEDIVEIFVVGDYEIERLDASVACRIHEVYHFDAILFHETDDIGFSVQLWFFHICKITQNIRIFVCYGTKDWLLQQLDR